MSPTSARKVALVTGPKPGRVSKAWYSWDCLGNSPSNFLTVSTRGRSSRVSTTVPRGESQPRYPRPASSPEGVRHRRYKPRLGQHPVHLVLETSACLHQGRTCTHQTAQLLYPRRRQVFLWSPPLNRSASVRAASGRCNSAYAGDAAPPPPPPTPAWPPRAASSPSPPMPRE